MEKLEIMYYDKAIKALDLLVKNCADIEEVDQVVKASIADALFYIAEELHELNKNINVRVDDGR